MLIVRIQVILVLVLALALVSCDESGSTPVLDLWVLTFNRGTVALLVEGNEITELSTHVSYVESDCTPTSASSCSFTVDWSIDIPISIDGQGDFSVPGAGFSITGNLQRDTGSGSGTVTTGDSIADCSCSWSGSWTADLVCPDMGRECSGPMDCSAGEICVCGRCEPPI